MAAKPFTLLATVGGLIVIGAGTGWLLRKVRKQKSAKK
jgi:hypothetical protein